MLPPLPTDQYVPRRENVLGKQASVGRPSIVLPIVATVAAMACFQIGAAIAKALFPVTGPQGAAVIRLCLGAAILLAFTRPWRAWPDRAPLLPLAGLGISMAVVIFMLFLALERLPLGVAIALQFLGPLRSQSLALDELPTSYGPRSLRVAFGV